MENKPVLYLNEIENAQLITDPVWNLPFVAGFRLRIENRLFNADKEVVEIKINNSDEIKRHRLKVDNKECRKYCKLNIIVWRLSVIRANHFKDKDRNNFIL